jgi:hypothetical protein
MKRIKWILSFGLMLLALFTTSAIAESPREQLNQMIRQLQQTPNDNALREKIIKLVQDLKPAPAVPEEARKQFVIGSTLVKQGTSLRGAYQAYQAFNKAADIAPWWGDAYWNCAVAADLAGMFITEKVCLKFYLLTEPGEKEAVQNRLYELEGKLMLAKSFAGSDGIEGFWEHKSVENIDNIYTTGTKTTFEIRKTGTSYRVNNLGEPEERITVQNAQDNSIKYSVTWKDGTYFYGYSCDRNGIKLICDIKDDKGKNSQEIYIKRNQCEVVDDQQGIQFGLNVLCK